MCVCVTTNLAVAVINSILKNDKLYEVLQQFYLVFAAQTTVMLAMLIQQKINL